MSDETPISGGPQPEKSALEKNLGQASEAVKVAAGGVATAVEAGRRPGMPLDVLARVTREAPLASLFVAFLFGVAVARRR